MGLFGKSKEEKIKESVILLRNLIKKVEDWRDKNIPEEKDEWLPRHLHRLKEFTDELDYSLLTLLGVERVYNDEGEQRLGSGGYDNGERIKRCLIGIKALIKFVKYCKEEPTSKITPPFPETLLSQMLNDLYRIKKIL